MTLFQSPKIAFAALTFCLVASSAASAQPRPFDKANWVSLATQTCMSQAPRNAQVAALDLSHDQLSYSCRCVARDMLTVLPIGERMALMDQIQSGRGLQQAGQRLFANSAVKKTIASCAASYYWN